MNIKSLKLSAAAALSLLLVSCAGMFSSPNPLVGTWDTTISTPMGAMNADLVVNDDLSGAMSSPQLGSASLENVLVDGQQVSFSTTVDAQGQMLTLNFDGTVEDDTLQGNFATDFGPIGVTATRRE